MKKLNIFKVLLLGLLVVATIMPTQMSAQRIDGFFTMTGDYIDRAEEMPGGSITIEGMQNQTPAPLGSGLLILIAAGVGYSLSRTKKLRKATLALVAVALLLGTTQCKKNLAKTSDSQHEHVSMTMEVGDGGRTIFVPDENGSYFIWNKTGNEYVYVSGNASGYLGMLSANVDGIYSTDPVSFIGEIVAPSDNDTKLSFFYLGNGLRDNINISAESLQIDFSNQTSGTVETVTNYLIASVTLPLDGTVVNGNQIKFNGTSYDVIADLKIQTAIAYFDLDGFVNANGANETVFIHGDDLYSTATIDFKQGTVRGSDKGYINVGEDGDKYVALIASTSGSTTLNFESNSHIGQMEFKEGIQRKMFYSNGVTNDVADPLPVQVESLPEDVLPGIFSVSPTRKVRFSKGNLKYSRNSTSDNWNTGTWSFMEHQYEYVEPNNWVGYDFVPENAIYENYDNKTEIGLFGWGCTGYRDEEHGDKEDYYLPNSTSYGGVYTQAAMIANAEKYGPAGSFDLSDANHSDWGYCMNHDEFSPWRSLTISEWWYMLGMSASCRSASKVSGVANARYTRAKVNDVYGLVILPDEYQHPVDVPELTAGFINHQGGDASFSNNNVDVITEHNWRMMEAAGAVFLPAAGERDEGDVFSVQDGGFYWSCTNVGASSAYMFNFDASFMTKYPQMRYEGFSVRLVYDFN